MGAPHASRCLLFDGDYAWCRRAADGRADPFWPATAVPADAAQEDLGALAGGAVTAAAAGGRTPPPEAEAIGLRALHDALAPEHYALAARARQLLHWRRTHRFCGCCGTPTVRHATDRAMRCPACGHEAYPRINPVVIVRIARGAQILLARRATGRTDFFSLLAGFVEPGETLEQAAAREVREEVGLEIRHLTYLASQPWPFPNNLMLGFAAEYAGGDLRPDGVEIGEAAWFDADRLPPLPSAISISRRLIDAFVAGQGASGASGGHRHPFAPPPSSAASGKPG